MNYTIWTNRGFNINDVVLELAPSEFVKQLNKNEVRTLPLVGGVLSKDSFQTITKTGELTGAYLLHTKDGKKYLTDIPDFDNVTFSDYINKSRDPFIIVGDIIIQSHLFDSVMLADAVPTE